MARDLTDRTIVITGASSGIGAATALACAAAGMHVLVHGRDLTRVEAVVTRVRALGRRSAGLTGDITAPGFSERLLEAAERELGGCYAVFANAGFGMRGAVHELAAEQLRRMFDVNFFAATDLLAQAARRLLGRRAPGHLLMCSSALAKFALPFVGAYAASKAAQTQMCRAMRMELRGSGIEVTAVHPITTQTPFFATAAALSGVPADAPEARRGPGLFVQTPERVASAVVGCLRRPRPEVWTSRGARLAAGVINAYPRLLDLFAGRRRSGGWAAV